LKGYVVCTLLTLACAWQQAKLRGGLGYVWNRQQFFNGNSVGWVDCEHGLDDASEVVAILAGYLLVVSFANSLDPEPKREE
jgi:hypothetical protein